MSMYGRGDVGYGSFAYAKQINNLDVVGIGADYTNHAIAGGEYRTKPALTAAVASSSPIMLRMIGLNAAAGVSISMFEGKTESGFRRIANLNLGLIKSIGDTINIGYLCRVHDVEGWFNNRLPSMLSSTYPGNRSHLGVLFTPGGIPAIAADWDLEKTWSVGMEYASTGGYFLRAGYRRDEWWGELPDQRDITGIKRLSFGAGMQSDATRLDYGYFIDEDMGRCHAISLTFLSAKSMGGR